MGIYERVTKALGFGEIEKKQSAASASIVTSPGQPVWTPRDYEMFAVEAYTKNAIAYQCINRIAEAVASVKLDVFQGDRELKSHPIIDLLKRPNPMQSSDEYMISKVSYLMIAGNGYEERVKVGGQIRELYQLRPDRMKVIPGASGVPTAYEHKVNNRRTLYPVDPIKMTSDVRHLRMFNPVNDWYGMSPIEPGAYSIDQLNESMQWMQAMFQNSARPSGALISDTELTPEQFDRLKDQMYTSHTGSKNAGRPMLFESGISWTAMGLSPVDMGVTEAKNSAARDVALSMGVPPQLLGIPGDNTYANYSEARLAFWEDTILPLLDKIINDWNAWFGQVYPNVEIRPNIDDIPAIADKRYKLWDMADKSRDLTIDERREMKGYDKLDDGLGDVIMVSSTEIPLDMAVSDIYEALTGAGQIQPPDDPDAPPPLIVDEVAKTRRIAADLVYKLAYGDGETRARK